MGDTLRICVIALKFLNAHVPPLDRIITCGVGQVITAAPHDLWIVEGSVPRRYRVELNGHGKILAYGMAGVTSGSEGAP